MKNVAEYCNMLLYRSNKKRTNYYKQYKFEEIVRARRR